MHYIVVLSLSTTTYRPAKRRVAVAVSVFIMCVHVLGARLDPTQIGAHTGLIYNMFFVSISLERRIADRQLCACDY